MLPETLKAVLATDTLERRDARPPDYRGENEALRELMELFARRPEQSLRRLAEIAMARCGAQSAGVSVEEDGPDGGRVFRWVATAGVVAPLLDSTLPCDASPCGLVVGSAKPQLLEDPARAYPAVGAIDPPVSSTLIVPFLDEGKPVGTLWVIDHGSGGRPFDAEDARLLESLAGFAAVAWRAQHDRQAVREGDAFLRLVTDRLPVRVAYIDREFRFQFMNDSYEREVGLVRAATLGKTLLEAFGEPMFERARSFYERAFAGETHTQEFEAPYPVGNRWIRVAYVPDFGEDGKVRGVVIQVLDVTEQRQSEATLREREADLRAILDASAGGFYGVDAEGRTTTGNAAFLSMLGIERMEDVVGKKLHGVIHHSHPDGSPYPVEECPIYRAASDGRPAHVVDELFYRIDDGAPFPVEYWTQPILVDGESRGAVTTFLDVTDRRQTEVALRESEAHYRTLFGSIDEAFCTFEMIFEKGKPVDYRFLEVNDAFVVQTGLSREDALGGRTMREMVPDHEQKWFDFYGAVALTGAPLRVEDHAEALGRWYEIHAFRIGGEDSHEIGAIFKDVSVRHEQERALAEERRRLDETLETAGVATFDWDVPGDHITGNRLLGLYYGMDPTAGAFPVSSALAGLRPEESVARGESLARALAQGGRYEAQYRRIGTDGRERWLLVRGEVVLNADGGALRANGVVLDVTERVRAEDAVRSQRTTLDRTLDTAQVAVFNWDVVADRVVGNDLLARFFGLPKRPEGSPIEPFFARIHPEDVVRTRKSVGRSLATGERYETQYRVLGEGDRERTLLARGETSLDGEGKAVRLFGVLLDVTERAEAEAERERLLVEVEIEQAKLRTIFEQAPAFIAVLRGRDLVFDYVNQGYYEIVGHRPLLGLPLVQAIPEATGSQEEGRDYDRLLLGVMDTGDHLTFNERPVMLQRTSGAPLEERFLDLAYLPLREADGTVSGVLVHGIDVTQGVVARKAIAEREELFRTVFEQAPDDAILVMDRDRTLTAWNPAAERITGWTAAEAIGQPADLIFTPEDVARNAPEGETEEAARDGKAMDERWHLRKDGARFWGSGTMNALHDAGGNVTGFLKVFRDATARYEEARTLAFLRRLTETVIDLRDPDAIIATAERMLGEHLGVSRVLFAEATEDGELVTVRQDWTDGGTPSLVGTHRVADFGPRARADVVQGNIHVSRDTELDYAPGEGLEAMRAVGVGAGITVPVHKEGRFTAILAIHGREPRDWTEDEIGLARQMVDRMLSEVERARAETALRASEERFRAAQDTTPDPFTIIEAVRDAAGEVVDFRWTYVNPATESLTGEREADQLGALVSEKRPGIQGGELWNAWLRTLETGEPFTLEQFMDFPRGRNFLRVTCVRVGDGIGSAFLDLTQRQLNVERLEEAVADRTAQLQAAVKEAEGFNYSIAHDLRTPLRAMVAVSGILMEDLGPELDEEHRGLLVRQAENAKRLGRLIDELLRLSRLSRAEVNRESLDMTVKAHSIFEELAEQHRTNGCRLEVQEGMTAQGDSGLVRTVLHNLIGNACKFSPNGGTIRVCESDGVFSVADEGVGFDMAFAPKIFIPFERLVSEAEFEGTGIGLANVERIVRRHNGRVWVESEPGKGTTFFFTLG